MSSKWRRGTVLPSYRPRRASASTCLTEPSTTQHGSVYAAAIDVSLAARMLKWRRKWRCPGSIRQQTYAQVGARRQLNGQFVADEAAEVAAKAGMVLRLAARARDPSHRS